MQKNEEGQPEVAPEKQNSIETVPVIPDFNEPVETNTDNIKKEKEELSEKLRKTEEEKTEQRLRETQEYISRTRKAAPEIDSAILPKKTFDDYLGDMEKIVDNDFESDPKSGLKKIVKKIVTDVAYDRDLERQQYQKLMSEIEEKAFRRAVSLDPEKLKIVNEVEKLDDERPDLKNLTFEQKMEFLDLRSGKIKKDNNRQQFEREREIISDVGSSKTNARSERIAAWANDPAVLQEGKGHFKSKEDMINWANPEKAREMGMKMFSRRSQ
jgi:hypothetical protein